MPEPKFSVPPEGYFVWTKKLGQRHYAKAGFDSETLCGMPMLGNNYASAIPIGEQTECQKCADILSSKLSLSCPRCGTRFAPSGTCPKCGTFVPEKLWYEPDILPEKSYSYAEMQFRIKTCQDVDTLKKVYSKLDTSTEFTEFDKEMLKEEIAQRMQVILEHEEAHKAGAGEKFAEGAAEYIKESDDEIIQQIKKEQGSFEGLKCTTIKSFHKPGYTVVVMKSYQERESVGSTSLYDINFKEESSAKRLETKLKVLFSSGSVEESNTMYDIKTSYNIEDLQEIKKIKLAALSGVKKIWVVNKGREGLILAAKYGKEWWEKAGQDDIERITVYEASAMYTSPTLGDRKRYKSLNNTDKCVGTDCAELTPLEIEPLLKQQVLSMNQEAPTLQGWGGSHSCVNTNSSNE